MGFCYSTFFSYLGGSLLTTYCLTSYFTTACLTYYLAVCFNYLTYYLGCCLVGDSVDDFYEYLGTNGFTAGYVPGQKNGIDVFWGGKNGVSTAFYLW